VRSWFIQGDETVGAGNEQGAADNVAEGDRYRVDDEKTTPGQPGMLDSKFVLQQEPDRNEVHVGPRMLEAAGGEGHDRRVAGEHLAGDAADGNRHEDCQADQPVAENAADQCDLEREAGFFAARSMACPAMRPLYHNSECSISQAKNSKPSRLPRMTTSQFPPTDFSLEGRLGQQRMTGEEFGTADDHQHQPDREDAAVEPSGYPLAEMRRRILGHDGRQLGAEGDIKARPQAENDSLRQRLIQHPPTVLDDRFGGFDRCQKPLSIVRPTRDRQPDCARPSTSVR
jgi:hypothetical protein